MQGMREEKSPGCSGRGRWPGTSLWEGLGAYAQEALLHNSLS